MLNISNSSLKDLVRSLRKMCLKLWTKIKAGEMLQFGMQKDFFHIGKLDCKLTMCKKSNKNHLYKYIEDG